MTRVRLNCPNCRQTVVLAAADLVLRVGPKDTAGIRFTCLRCEARIDTPANPRAVDSLTAAGVSIIYITSDDEEPPSALSEPINARDVFDFIYALAVTDTPQAELLNR